MIFYSFLSVSISSSEPRYSHSIGRGKGIIHVHLFHQLKIHVLLWVAMKLMSSLKPANLEWGEELNLKNPCCWNNIFFFSSFSLIMVSLFPLSFPIVIYFSCHRTQHQTNYTPYLKLLAQNAQMAVFTINHRQSDSRVLFFR